MEHLNIFLGGACNPTTWRRDIAIPMLEAAGVSYHNPQRDDWTPEMIPGEAQAKDEADVLLFIIGPETRAIGALVEVAELVHTSRWLVLCIVDVPRCASIRGDEIGDREWEDLNAGRAYVRNLADRKRFPVYTDVRVAVDAAIDLVRKKNAPPPPYRETVAEVGLDESRLYR